MVTETAAHPNPPPQFKEIIMLTVSHRTLKFLAAFVWYIGSFVLLLKGGSLMLEAKAIEPDLYWPWLIVACALLFGGVKARYLFSKSCRKNLVRIEALSEPKLWQFFRPRFFLALALMIATGATLSRLANGRYVPLLAVALLDLSIGFALLVSSVVFWQTKYSNWPMPASVTQQENPPR